MGSLFAALRNTAGAMDVYGRQFSVIQDNVANADTPGYAKQTQSTHALNLNIDLGLTGGIGAGPLVSSRSEYAEQNIRLQTSQLGTADQKASDLAALQSQFDLTTGTGVAGAINSLFNSFSQLSVSPNDQTARQTVLNNASALADSFNQASQALTSASQGADTQVRDYVDNINQIASQIVLINKQYASQPAATTDPGLDAQLHADLEQLSQIASVSVIRNANGSMNVYLAGRIPLAIADHQFQLTASTSSQQTEVLDSTGADISAEIDSGRMAGALQDRNQLIPSYLSDLNKLASSLADAVNTQLARGVDQNGAAPTKDLFSYDANSGAASSLRINPLTTDQIAAATPDSPGGNANALNLAALANAQSVNGSTFTGAFGVLGTRVGNDISAAQQNQASSQATLAQAKSLRDQQSGVSLNDEAAELQQVQRAYQAASKMMTVVNSMLDTLMNALNP